MRVWQPGGKPAEYRSQDCRERHEYGIDKLMWGADYPHLEGTWPNTRNALRETFGGVPEAELRAMLGENAASVFDFDMTALSKAVAEVGPQVEDILDG